MKLNGFRSLSLVIVLLLIGCQASSTAAPTHTLASTFLIPNTSTASVPNTQSATVMVSIDGSSPSILISPLTQFQFGVYTPLEISIQTNISAENPFNPNELDIRVVFTSPSGKQMAISAFWGIDYSPAAQSKSPDTGWKARFTPTETGTWTATAYIPSPTLTSNTVKFEVTPSNNPGFVRIDSENPRYFAFDNGDFFFPIGINLAWWCGTCDPLDTYRQMMDEFHAQGGNTIRVWMASWSFGIETTTLGNYKDRMYEAWLLDEVFKMAQDRGMYIILVLLNCLDFSEWTNAAWSSNVYNAAMGGPLAIPQEFVTSPQGVGLFEQRLNYIINRWGYSPNLLAWEWWNEVNLSPITDDLLKPWLQEVTAFLHARDVNHHLTTNSFAIRDQSVTWQMPELDIVMKHEYTDQVSSVNRDLGDRALADFNKVISGIPAKPVLLGEFGYSTNFDEEISETTGVHLHNGIWATTFAGYAGSGMYWNWDTVLQRYNLWYHFKGLSRFLEGVDLPGYASFTSLDVTVSDGQAGSAIAMALHGKDTLVWIRNNEYTTQVLPDEHKFVPSFLSNQVLTLHGMAAGTYTVMWYDTLLAQWTSQTTFSADGQNLVIPIPSFNRDIAARIVKNP